MATDRLATVMRKASLLSTLCDVPVCVLCFDRSGRLSTWPENRSDVLPILDRFKNCSKKRKLASDPQNPVADPIPRLCYYENPIDRSRSLTGQVDALGNLIERIEGLEKKKRIEIEELGFGFGFDEAELGLLGFEPIDEIGIGNGWCCSSSSSASSPEAVDKPADGGSPAEKPADEAELGFGIGFDKAELGLLGFGSIDEIGIGNGWCCSSASSPETVEKPADGDLWGELDSLDALILKIRAMEEKEIEIKVEEKQSEGGELDFSFWDELPQLDHHDSSSSPCSDFDLDSIDFF